MLEQGQSSARDIKNENHFLKDYIHRLNATISEYQAKYPSAVRHTLSLPFLLNEIARREEKKENFFLFSKFCGVQLRP